MANNKQMQGMVPVDLSDDSSSDECAAADIAVAEAELALAKARAAAARKNRWTKTSGGSTSGGSSADATGDMQDAKKHKMSPGGSTAGSDAGTDKASASPATSTSAEEGRIARMAAESGARAAFEKTLEGTSAKLAAKGIKATAEVPMQLHFNSGVPPPPLPPKGGWAGLDKDRKKKISPDNVAEIAEMVAKVEVMGVKPRGSVAAAVFPGIIPEALQQSSACAAVTPAEEDADVGADVVKKADHSGEAFTCSQCKCEVAKASGFLLTEGPCDWAGVLWGCCFACSDVFVELEKGTYLYGNPSLAVPKKAQPAERVELSAAAQLDVASRIFRKKVGRQWERHASERNVRAQRVRGIKFGNLEAEMMIIFKGASKADVRNLTIARLRFVATAFAASIDRESEALKAASRANYTAYVAQVIIATAEAATAEATTAAAAAAAAAAT